MGIIILVVVIVVIVGYIISLYNKLVKSRNKVKTNWSQIDVVLKRRVDLIPNLVESVKGYAKHEKETLNQVIEARNTYVSSSSMADKMASDHELSQALNKLFMLAEAYPDLKANTNFIQLQNELKDSEDKISFARQFYNDSVYSYQNLRETFPSSLISNLFHFEEMPFYEIEEQEKVTPKVEF